MPPNPIIPYYRSQDSALTVGSTLLLNTFRRAWHGIPSEIAHVSSLYDAHTLSARRVQRHHDLALLRYLIKCQFDITSKPRSQLTTTETNVGAVLYNETLG